MQGMADRDDKVQDGTVWMELAGIYGMGSMR